MATLPKRQPAKPAVRNFFTEWAVNVLILLFATSTVMQAFVVPTASMENTVLVGDHMFVDKLAYAPAGSLSRHLLPYTDVKRGDIVVFHYPVNINENYVKRVIGVPGDRVHIINKEVYVNDKKLVEPYKVLISERGSNYLDNFPQAVDIQIDARGHEMLAANVVNGELVVPPGQYFALGDNRDNSADSRFWGFVPRENIVRKPVIIFWSYDAPTEDWAGTVNVTHLGDLVTHIPQNQCLLRTRHEPRP